MNKEINRRKKNDNKQHYKYYPASNEKEVALWSS